MTTKTASTPIPKELLEQIYAEVERLVEAKFETRVRSLEKEKERLDCESDVWRKKYFSEQERSRKLEGELGLAHQEIKALKEVIEKQNARIAGLEKIIHGKKSEASQSSNQPSDDQQTIEKRSRGRQPGSKGHGRKRRTELEPEECPHDIEPGEKLCSICGAPFEEMGTKDSEEIDISYKLVRKIHRRKKYRRTCQCPSTKMIKTAPTPLKLFKGSLFSIEFWHYIIYDKYHLQRPLNRVRQFLNSHGLTVSQGTLTNGLKRLHDRKVFKPLLEDVAKRVKSASRQQMDETGWKIFQEIEGKEGYAHWLWVNLTADCCLFSIDPARSRQAAKRFLGDAPVIVTTDMLKAYENLGDHVTNSWCWAHVRRYVLKLASFVPLKSMSEKWVKKIDWLYHLNNARLAAVNEQDFLLHDTALRVAIKEFELQAKSIARRAKHPESKQVFSMIANHWRGLSLFVELPAVPMDNNLSEQALRNSVVGRKNYYGSGALWSGQLAADLFTLFATLEMNGINSRVWLLEYLHAVAKNGGYAPPNATEFLPWNSPPTQLFS